MGLAILITIAITCARSDAQTSAQATTFVQNIYAHYGQPGTEAGPRQGGVERKDTDIYSPSLLALINRDRRLAGPGYVGNLDFDPVCECQDDGGMTFSRLNVAKSGPQTAIATVELSFPEPRQIHVQLFLLWTAHGWRIDEIKADNLPSLRKLLKH